MDPLTGAEKKRMRGLAQRMKPHLRVGKQGFTPALLGELDAAFSRVGLVKVRFEGDREAVRNGCELIPSQLACELVGQVGRTAAFYRKPTEPPGDGGEG